MIHQTLDTVKQIPYLANQCASSWNINEALPDVQVGRFYGHMPVMIINGKF